MAIRTAAGRRSLAAAPLLALLTGSLAFAAAPDDVAKLVAARDPGALAAAEALTRTDPRSADAWVLLSRAQLAAGRREAALDSAERAVSLDAKNPRAQFALGNAYGANITDAGMLAQMRMAPKLRDAFLKAVELDPDNLDARQALVEFYLQAPGVVGGGLDKARAEAAEVAKRGAYEGHLARASIAAAEDRDDEAIAESQAAWRLRPDDPEARVRMGLAYQRAKRWDDAFRHFETWTRETPTAARAWYQLGRTAVLSGQRLDAGAAAFRRYLDLPRAPGDPEPQHAYYRMGQAYAKTGKAAEARAAFEAALKIDPKMKGPREELAKLK